MSASSPLPAAWRIVSSLAAPAGTPSRALPSRTTTTGLVSRPDSDGSLDLRHESAGRPRTVPPPAGRAGPDHIRRVDEEHGISVIALAPLPRPGGLRLVRCADSFCAVSETARSPSRGTTRTSRPGTGRSAAISTVPTALRGVGDGNGLPFEPQRRHSGPDGRWATSRANSSASRRGSTSTTDALSAHHHR